jgi:hypothetical protein
MTETEAKYLERRARRRRGAWLVLGYLLVLAGAAAFIALSLEAAS